MAAKDLSEALKLVLGTVAATAANPGVVNLVRAPADQPNTCQFAFGSPGSVEGPLNVLKADGTIVCTSRAPGSAGVRGTYAGADWLAPALSGPLLLAPATDPLTGDAVALSTAPIGADGVMVAFIRLEPVGPTLASRYGGSRKMEYR